MRISLGRQEQSQESELTESLPDRKMKPEPVRRQACLTSPESQISNVAQRSIKRPYASDQIRASKKTHIKESIRHAARIDSQATACQMQVDLGQSLEPYSNSGGSFQFFLPLMRGKEIKEKLPVQNLIFNDQMRASVPEYP